MKVLVDELPRMLREIVEDTISRQPDMDLIQLPPRGAPGPTEPDVVITGAIEPEHSSHSTELLVRWPRARVIAIAIAAPHAVLYSLREHRTPLGEMSSGALVEAIRRAFADRNA